MVTKLINILIQTVYYDIHRIYTSFIRPILWFQLIIALLLVWISTVVFAWTLYHRVEIYSVYYMGLYHLLSIQSYIFGYLLYGWDVYTVESGQPWYILFWVRVLKVGLVFIAWYVGFSIFLYSFTVQDVIIPAPRAMEVWWLSYLQRIKELPGCGIENSANYFRKFKRYMLRERFNAMEQERTLLNRELIRYKRKMEALDKELDSQKYYNLSKNKEKKHDTE